MVKAVSLLAGTLSLCSLAAAGTWKRLVDGDQFNLTGYSNTDDIGGMSVVALDGEPYICDIAKLNDTSISPEIVTFTKAGNTWLASTPSSSLNGALWYLPGPGATNATKTPGFSPNGTLTADEVSETMGFYGNMAYLAGSEGILTLFGAKKTSTVGLYTLTWNATVEEDTMPLTIKKTSS